MNPNARLAVVAVALVILAAIAWRFVRAPESTLAVGNDAASTSSASRASGGGTTSADAGRYPHAQRDRAKRDELQRRLLAASEEAARAAKAEASAAAASGAAAPVYRGNRESNDIAEFGRFAAQAIREDFIPMARACAQDLATRQPDAGGTVRVAFELLGDKAIGGVVNSSEIDGDKSTLHDEKFETCMRESMYGVYFDPPPANARATLNFDVDVKGDGKGTIDEEVEDFHPRDRRNEK